MKIKKVKTTELSPGTILARDIYTADRKYLLLREGTRLSRDLIEGLLRKEISDVLVYEEQKPVYVPVSVPLPPDAKRRKEVGFTYPESLEQRLFIEYGGKIVLKIDDPEVNATKKKAVKSIREVLRKVAVGNEVDFMSMKRTADDLIRAVYKNIPAVVNISGVRMIDEYTFFHSVNVAAYTTIIAQKHSLSKKEIETVCTGALLHDVGKMLVSPYILNKPGKLTKQEFEEMKQHTLRGYSLLKENGISEQIACLAKGHHERCDGSGYPERLQCHSIPSSVQMTAISDVYDALTSDRVYKKAIGSNNAMAILMSESGRRFNSRFVSFLQHTVGIYPIGSLVRLNNGCIARVLEQNEGIVRPVVQLVLDPEGRKVSDEVVLNLMDSTEVYILEGYTMTSNLVEAGGKVDR